MKIDHKNSVGLSIRNEETGQLEEAVWVECLPDHPEPHPVCVLYDRVYHALAVEKRRAMRAGRGSEVRACWVLSNHLSVGGKASKKPRLHFVDYSSPSYRADRVNGGQTLWPSCPELPNAPSEADVRALNKDPEHPLWDVLLPLLHPNLEGL